MSTRTQLLLFTSVVILLMLSMGGFQARQLQTVLGKLEEVAIVQVPAVVEISYAEMRQESIRALVYLAAITKDPKQMKVVQADQADFSKDFNERLQKLKTMERLNTEAKAALEAALSEADEYTKISENIIAAYDKGETAKAEAQIPEFSSKYDTLQASMRNLSDYIKSDALSLKSSGQETVQIALATSGAAVLVTILFSLFVVRRLLRRMSGIVNRLAATSTKIDGVVARLKNTSNNMNDTTNQAAASLEETAASMEQISSLVHGTTSKSSEMTNLANTNERSAGLGEQQIRSLADFIDSLGKKSEAMEEIINTIDDIAFQTNLLALNAAVEAARAGENGRGFAVVAEAVRTLALKSGESAKHISTMVKNNIDEISAGRKKTDTTMKAIGEVISGVKRTTIFSNEVKAASVEQAEGLNQVTKAITSLDQIFQNNAEQAGEILFTAHSVESEAKDLQAAIGEIELSLFGSTKMSIKMAETQSTEPEVQTSEESKAA